ncbi:MAG TPA: hypothetical protein VMH89_02210 [Candidatus Acidoferrum sp.]|nr:hypothetical protein [Candidatus Acidoferrum sp.]
MLGMFSLVEWGDIPLSSFQMLVTGGGLLLFAAILLMVRRKSRVEVESSMVTEELMAYLARIANALENPREQTTKEELTAEVLRRLQEIAAVKPNGKVREMTLMDR